MCIRDSSPSARTGRSRLSAAAAAAGRSLGAGARLPRPDARSRGAARSVAGAVRGVSGPAALGRDRDGAGSVSYTHLDVYKRQIRERSTSLCRWFERDESRDHGTAQARPI